MSMSFIEWLFIVSLIVPAAGVIVGGLFLAAPWGRRKAGVTALHAHAH
jgi:hypothetical protein